MIIQKGSPEWETMNQVIQNSKSYYLSLLKTLVDINTDTGNKAGSVLITEILQKELESIGAKVERVESSAGIHLIARFYGQGNKKVLIYDHTDTVLHNFDDFHFRYDADREIAYGPGTSDSKGSVAFLIENLKNMAQLNLAPYKELILYLDAEEEGSSETSDRIITQLAQEVDYAFIADAGRPQQGIVTKRKTVGRYEILIEGISGHAGNGAHCSVNAMTEAGYLIVTLDQLQSPFPKNPLDYTQESLKKQGVVDSGQFVPDNTINVGVLQQLDGGKANIIPGKIKLVVDVRCFEQSEHTRIEKAIFDLAHRPHSPMAKITITGSQNYGSVESAGTQEKLANLYVKLGKDLLDKNIVQWRSGGVTPGNIVAHYAPIVDSVGMDANPELEHSIYEELYVDAYVPRSILMISFLIEADRMKFS